MPSLDKRATGTSNLNISTNEETEQSRVAISRAFTFTNLEEEEVDKLAKSLFVLSYNNKFRMTL